MKTVYEIICTADIGKSVNAVGDLLKGINSEMSSLGFDEKLVCLGEFSIGTITSDRELNQEEIDKMKTIFDAEFLVNSEMSKHGVRVKSICRQSGQSSRQSQ